MAHTVHMDHTIRPGTARRLSLRAPEMPGRLDFRRDLTGAQRTQIERAWLLHKGDWRMPANRSIPWPCATWERLDEHAPRGGVS